MASPQELIHHLKHRYPATWSLVKLAASQGLVEFGATSDSLEVSPDLRFRHPRLFQILGALLEEGVDDPEATARSFFDGTAPATIRRNN